jgi:hypothetical protein
MLFRWFTVIMPCRALVRATFKRRPSAMNPTLPNALERTLPPTKKQQQENEYNEEY